MKRTIAIAAVIFAIAAAAMFQTNLIGAAGEPLVVLAMGSLFIVVSKWISPPPAGPDAVVSDLQAVAA